MKIFTAILKIALLVVVVVAVGYCLYTCNSCSPFGCTA